MGDYQEIKRKLSEYCSAYVAKRRKGIEARIRELKEGLDSEGKNTAGDKHETGRAMIQLEMEKLSGQWSELERLEGILQKIDLNAHSGKASLGSVVLTDKGNYFMSISAGQYQIGEKTFICIGVATPLGQAILGKSKADTFVAPFGHGKVVDLL